MRQPEATREALGSSLIHGQTFNVTSPFMHLVDDIVAVEAQFVIRCVSDPALAPDSFVYRLHPSYFGSSCSSGCCINGIGELYLNMAPPSWSSPDDESTRCSCNWFPAYSACHGWSPLHGGSTRGSWICIDGWPSPVRRAQRPKLG